MFGDESYARFADHLGPWLDEDELEEEVTVPKRVPLSALGDDWFVPCISLVKQGQVPKAKIIALKSKLTESGQEMLPADVVIDAFRDGLGVTTAEAEEILRAIVTVARGTASTPPEDEEAEEAAVATKSSERRDSKGRMRNKRFGVTPEYEAPIRDAHGRRVNKPLDPLRRR